MKTKKSYTVSLIILLLLAVTVGLTSCSKDSEDAPTYYIKATNVSNVLQNNTDVMFKIHMFIVSQYDEGAQYIQADENTAKTKFQKVVDNITSYAWEQNGDTLASDSYLTLELRDASSTVVASTLITLK